MSVNTLYNIAKNIHHASLPDDFELDKGAAHIWILNQDQAIVNQIQYVQLLSHEEQERMRAFKHQDVRQRFVCRRSILRLLLALYTKQHPADLNLLTAKYGKPYLANSELQFNISHSQHLAIMAFAHHKLGIDIESVQPIADAELVVKHQYSDNEQSYWFSLNAEERLTAFYKIWTSKEAFVKLIGTGLKIPLKSFDIVLNGDARTIRLSNNDTRAYHVYDLAVSPDYISTLMTPQQVSIKLRRIQ